MQQVIVVFLSGLMLALVVRMDAKLIGPYFSLSQLIPGFPGFDAPIWNHRAALRWAVFRRFVYPLLFGALLALLGNPLGTVIASALFGAFLLIWPALFIPRPWGVSNRDWRYAVLNASLLVGFSGLSATGSFVTEIMTILGGGDVGKYVLENLFLWIVTLIVTTTCLAFTKGTFMGLKETAERRRGDPQLGRDSMTNIVDDTDE